MPRTRREFLTYGSVGMLTAALEAASAQTPSQEPTPGAPPAFGTAPAVGPEVSAATFAEAQKLVQVDLRPSDREQAAANWRMQMAPNYEFRVGPRKVVLEDTLAPATLWNPAQPGIVKQNGEAKNEAISFAAALPSAACPPATKPLPMQPWRSFHAGLKARPSPRSASPISISIAFSASIRSFAASSPSPAITRSRRRGRRTRKLRPAIIAARCMEFPGAPRTCSTPPTFPPPMAPNPIASACPRPTAPWSRGSMRPAPCWSPS